MKKFNIKKILIPIDFSETSLLAFDHGVQLASVFGADILLLHVVKPNWTIFAVENSPLPMNAIQYQSEVASEKLETLAKKIHNEEAVIIETICETGRVCPVILSAVDKYKVDLIVMGTHGASGFEERFIGSNAYRVVNESHCPVLTVQKHSVKKEFKDIVLPIDNSFYSRQKVNHAIMLAEHYGSRIHILGLLNSDDESEKNKLKIKIEQVEEMFDRHKILYSRQIQTGVNFGKIVIGYAEKLEADLIMIMTEWEEDITGIFIGPFARQIVNHSTIPVMSIRPNVKSQMLENGVMSWMEQH
jgi:nucleotide-binding universal stress UspA family protein